jgi:hypothetical protein
MIIFSRIELFQDKNLSNNRILVKRLTLLNFINGLLILSLINSINTRPILSACIITLSIKSGRIMTEEE